MRIKKWLSNWIKRVLGLNVPQDEFERRVRDLAGLPPQKPDPYLEELSQRYEVPRDEKKD